MRIALLIVSDRASDGTYVDDTGPALARLLTNDELVTTEIVPDERELIARQLREWCDQDVADIIVASGGTGLSARDVTPEATLDVVEREIPGLGEAMRAAGRAITPLADLSRQVVGQRKRTIVVNVPGSPKGATESFTAIAEALPHAVELIRA
jgi:molybdopterin adenylyltransferase